MTSIGPGFFQVADSKYCADESCRSECAKDSTCKFYYGDEENKLYARGGDGPNPPGPPGPGPNPRPKDAVFNLMKAIKELQNLEQYLFQKLEEANARDPNSDESSRIVKRINELSNLRTALFTQLKVLYKDLAKFSKIEQGALADQIISAKLLESRLNDLKLRKDKIQAVGTDKLRMVQIGQYEYLRYSAHKSFMKVIVFTSLGVIFFSMLLKNNIGPNILGTTGVILSLAIGLVVGGRQLVDILSRDNMNYNQINFGNDTSSKGSGGESVWEHDKKFFQTLWQNVQEDAASSFSGEINKAAAEARRFKRHVKRGVNRQRHKDRKKRHRYESFSVVTPAPAAGSNNWASAKFN